jgi:hypothetical protein
MSFMIRSKGFSVYFVADEGFACKIAGGHRPPLQCTACYCRGAL